MICEDLNQANEGGRIQVLIMSCMYMVIPLSPNSSCWDIDDIVMLFNFPKKNKINNIPNYGRQMLERLDLIYCHLIQDVSGSC